MCVCVYVCVCACVCVCVCVCVCESGIVAWDKGAEKGIIVLFQVRPSSCNQANCMLLFMTQGLDGEIRATNPHSLKQAQCQIYSARGLKERALQTSCGSKEISMTVFVVQTSSC